MRSQELESYQRWTRGLTSVTLAAKAILFLLFFLWAARSDLGAAALEGAVSADLFTWVVFSLLGWPFRGFQVRLGAVFEIALVIFFVWREPLFDIDDDAATIGLACLFFILFAVVKTVLWIVEQNLASTGLRSRASP